MTRPTPRHGFSLIELLVVVSATALLIGILLPVLGSARDAGRSVKCLSNLRQMGIAAHAYTASHDEVFPPAYHFPGGGDSLSWEINTIGGVHRPGLLWDGQGVVEIAQCPSYDGPDNWSSAPYSGYNYNTSFIGHGQFEANPAPARVGQINQPAGCALFGDGGFAGGANKFMRSPLADAARGDTIDAATRAAGTQSFRHDGATQVVYADGHGRTQTDRFTAANPGVADGTGFLSDDNAVYDLE